MVQFQRQLHVYLILIVVLFFSPSCKQKKTKNIIQTEPKEIKKESLIEVNQIDYDTSQWKEITEQSGIVLDIRYATDNNFTKKQIYSCPRCFLRPALANKILRLQKDISNKYSMNLKLFDCYRPRPAQQKLWDIVPDARYVTPPTKGSMHNKGLAVDITLVNEYGKELDMGTEYDFFGPEAYTTNTNLPEEVLKNRKILTKLMKLHGLEGIRTEWWHYSLKTEKADLDSWEWECD